MRKSNKVESSTLKKSVSVSSFSDSCSNCSSKENWKRCLSENGNLFYAKYIQKSGSYVSGQKKDGCQGNQSESLKLSTVNNEDLKELTLIVSPLDRYRFGRRSSIIESMLGFGVVPFVDNVECLMVANIIDTSLKVDYPFINEGDWFKSLENIEVRTGNIDKLLLQYNRVTKVKLTFKGFCNLNVPDEKNTFREINNFDEFAYAYKNSFQNEIKLQEQKCPIFLALIMNREYLRTNNTECMFYYPDIPNNFLYKAKGSFLTLDSVINNDLKSSPLQSTIIVEDSKFYITYGHVNGTLVVCAFSTFYQSRKAAKSNGSDFLNFLRFNISDFRSLQVRQYLTQACEIFKITIQYNVDNSIYDLCIGACLRGSPCIALPKEAQLRICDSLSELESVDFKKWNESQQYPRDLIICGTALYYKKYLLSSNLPYSLRINIERVLRVRGITEFVLHQNVKKMYIWEKIHHSDSKHQRFMAICIHNYLLLVVILKSTMNSYPNISCISYMDEITDTIDYLISSGMESISQFWIDSNKRPSISLNKANSQLRHKFKFMRQKGNSSENIDNSYPLCDSPSHSLSQSEDSCRKKVEVESAFDWQAFGNKNEFRDLDKTYGYNEPLSTKVKNMTPSNLTTGWSNDLIFFIHVNFADALIMEPFKSMCSDLHLSVIKEYILLIHEILQINSSLKNLPDTASNLSKSAVVVKEHSISVDLITNSGDKEGIVIVGRLFFFPLKEVYVCFGKNTCQNLVELSFRMSFLNIG